MASFLFFPRKKTVRETVHKIRIVTISAMVIPDEEDGGEKRYGGWKSDPEGKQRRPVSEVKKSVPPEAYAVEIEGIVRISLSGKVRFPFRLRIQGSAEGENPVRERDDHRIIPEYGAGP